MNEEIFRSLLPDITESLSLDIVRPYLRQKELLSAEEYEDLLRNTNDSQSTKLVIERVIALIRKKGPNAPKLFLEALQESLQHEGDAGNAFLVERLQEKLESGRGQSEPHNDAGARAAERDPALVQYLKLINRVIDGLKNDSETCFMNLRRLGARPPSTVATLHQLFEYLQDEDLCGPRKLSLLEDLLEAMDRPDLKRQVQAFKAQVDNRESSTSDQSPSLVIITHHSREVQSTDAICTKLSAMLSLQLPPAESSDNGYTLLWRVSCLEEHLPTLESAVRGGAGVLRDLDIQRVFFETPQGRFKVYESQDPHDVALETACSDQALYECSKSLVEWEGLAILLGLTQAEIAELKFNYPQQYSEQKMQLFLKWKRKFGSGATFRSLLDAVLRTGDRQFANVIKRIAQTPN